MAFTHTINYSWSNGSASLSKSISQSAETEINIDMVAEATNNATKHPMDLILIASKLKSMYIVSDKAVTVWFNSTTADMSSSSGELLQVSLAANVPYLWIDDSNFDNPLTDDIDSIRVNNGAAISAANDATVKFRFLVDTSS